MTSTLSNSIKSISQGNDTTKKKTGILDRYPVVTVLVFASVGVAAGIGLSFWNPDDSTTKDVVIQWIGLVGDVFIRALKAIVLPLVFVNVIMSVVDMLDVGSGSTIGWYTIGLYFVTTLIASIISLVTIVIFNPLFKTDATTEDHIPGRVHLACDSDHGSYLSQMPDGSVACVNATMATNDTDFYLNDVDGTYVMTTTGVADDMSLSDTLYQGVFMKLVSDNIFDSFVEANFAAVVIFAIFIGVALARVLQENNTAQTESSFLRFIRELDQILMMLINWVIVVTPFAVLSLIASAIGSQNDLMNSLENLGYLILAVVVAMVAHHLVVHHGLYALLTRKNSLTYVRQLVPAMTTAFACSSSAATMPVTLTSVAATGMVPDYIAKFVIPLGATVNMDGAAVYIPMVCVWLAYLNDVKPTVANYILLCFMATVGSMGAAPVPSAGLVLVITTYNTVFGTTGTPEGFALIMGIDWLFDRLATVLNITGDAVVTGIVASKVARLDDGEASTDSEDLGESSADSTNNEMEEDMDMI